MRMLKQVHSRLFLLLVLALACIRVVARILPISRAARAAKRDELRNGVQRSLQVRTVGAGGRSYAVRATGSFPYVRVVSMSMQEQVVPVPVEIAGLSPAEIGKSGHKAASHALTLKSKPAAPETFCLLTDCTTDCTDCGGCTDCTTCCTDCTGCFDCTTTAPEL